MPERDCVYEWLPLWHTQQLFVARTWMKGNANIAKMHEKGEGSLLVPTTGDAEEVRLVIDNELIVKNNTIF